MKKYDSYKDSGIEWIGEIPGHWMVKKIKHRCYVKARVGWKGLKSDEFLSDGYAYLVTGSDFKNDKVDWKECYHIDKDRYDEDPYIQLQEEDLLITKDGTIGKLAIVNNLHKPACLNSGIFVVRSTQENLSTGYLFWILKSKLFTQFNEYTSYGSTIQHLYQNVFVEFGFTFPSKQEQTTIANYLDRKTAEIDELIADKKRLLELYEEEKKAIINQAVTKGINPNAPMKDSGIEWLGGIPEHWEVSKISKTVSKITNGYVGPVREVMRSEGIPYIQGIHIKNGTIQFTPNGNYYVSNEWSDNHEKSILAEGDVLVVQTGTIGDVGIVPKKYEGANCHALLILRARPEIIFPMFLQKLLSSKFGFDSLQLIKTGEILHHINGSKLKGVDIPTPPLSEQQSIVSHIETKCARIDVKKSRTEKLIELLTEYRTALISEVVTGKIKVED